MTELEAITLLHDYSSGKRGTRATIDLLGLRDFADLLIALGQQGLDLPGPSHSAAIMADRDRARALLMPRLEHAA